jgi:hypothetical protein
MMAAWLQCAKELRTVACTAAATGTIVPHLVARQQPRCPHALGHLMGFLFKLFSRRPA